jgi:hypothetical protein
MGKERASEAALHTYNSFNDPPCNSEGDNMIILRDNMANKQHEVITEQQQHAI